MAVGLAVEVVNDLARDCRFLLVPTRMHISTWKCIWRCLGSLSFVALTILFLAIGWCIY